MSEDILTLKPPPYDARLAYGSDPNQFLDLRVPKTKGIAPLVINVRGGFWRGQDHAGSAGHPWRGVARTGNAGALATMAEGGPAHSLTSVRPTAIWCRMLGGTVSMPAKLW